MAKRIGTQGTAPFVIQDTDIPAPAGHSDHNVGGPFHVSTLADLKAIPEYYLIDRSTEVERPVWGAMGYVHSDTTPENNGRWELKKGLVDNDITNPDNWQKMQTEGAGIDSTDDLDEGGDNKYFTEARAVGSKLAGYVKSETVEALTASKTVIEALSILEKALDGKVTLTPGGQLVVAAEKNRWNDTYTKSETENKIDEKLSNLVWRDAVENFSDLAATYPTAVEGWAAIVNSENTLYRYDGSTWINIGGFVIPKATASVDGIMSKEDFAKLRDIETEATKNATDAQLRDRSTHTGTNPISSIQGFDEAPINSVPAKKSDGTSGWVVYNAPKACAIRKADGTLVYFDTLQEAITDSESSSDPTRIYDTYEIYQDLDISYGIYLSGNRTLQMNGFSIRSSADRCVEIDNGDEEIKILNGHKLIGNGSSWVVYASNVDVTIQASIENLDGNGILFPAGKLEVYGDIIAKGQTVYSPSSPDSIEIKGNVTSLEGVALEGSATVYGNVITKSSDKPALQSAYHIDYETKEGFTTIYGDVIVDNPLSEAPAVLLSSGQSGYSGNHYIKVSGSIIPALGPAIERTGWDNFTVTFLGFLAAKGDIIDHLDPIDYNPLIVTAEVPFPDGVEGIEDVIAGTNVNIDKTDPKNPIISAAGGSESTQSDWNQNNSESPDFIKNKPALFSGDYGDLSGKPALFSGSWNDLTGKPSSFDPSPHTHVIEDVTGLGDALNSLEYVLKFDDENKLTYNFGETVDIKITAVKGQGDQEVDLGDYEINDTLPAYTALPITVDKTGWVEIKAIKV